MLNTSEKTAPTSAAGPCPLARDQDGNPIELPATAVGWRVRRKTGGRPRLVLDVQKQPVLLPLPFTVVDLEDVLAPGSYLLDIVDGKGEPLGLTIGASIGQLRNADGSADQSDESDEHQRVAPMLPSTGSEIRLVLEANIRATQLAFQHNQKSLELGLRMAETLRDGVHVLADAQAEWIKSLSSARGFFRNAPPPPPQQLLAPAQVEQDDDDDEEDDAEEQAPLTWVEQIGPLVAIAVEKITTTVMNMKMAGAGAGAAAGQGAAVGQGLELPDLFDWRRAAKKGNATREDGAVQQVVTPESPPEANVAEPHAVTAGPKARMHFMAILSALSADERRHAQAAATMLTHEQQHAWLDQLKSMSIEDGVQAIRDAIARAPKA